LPASRSCRRALGIFRGGAGHDEVSGSSPWCYAIGEVKEGFRAAALGCGGGALMIDGCSGDVLQHRGGKRSEVRPR
jgi:hypothetical protein